MSHIQKIATFLSCAFLLFFLLACNGTQATSADGDEKSHTTKPGEMQMEDFFKNPEKISFRISPNGEYLSYLAPHNERINIYVQKLGETEATRITNITLEDLRGYIWANDNRLLYLKEQIGTDNLRLFAIDKDGNNEKDITPFDSTSIQIIDELEGRPNEVILGMNHRNKRIFDAYRLNINTGKLDVLAENPGNYTGWMTDHEGKLRIASSTNGVSTTLLYRATEGESFKEVLTTDFKESVTPIFFDFDNKNVYAVSNIGRDKQAIVEFDIATGKEVKVIYEHPDVDVSSIAYSRKRKVLTTVVFTEAQRKRAFLDDQAKQLYDRLEKELGDYEILITGASQNEDKFLVRTFSDRSLGTYYFYDTASDQLTKIADVSPWIDEAKMCAMKPIEFEAHDGLRLHGYLTLPNGVTPRNLPIVVMVHGGPWARDNWGYDPQVQFLANRGYGVLQINYRGSTGYGRAFWKKSFKQWGQDMQTDINDGVNWLIKGEVADPKRIAIYGSSYGGYAALMGAVKDPDLYACAIDFVGISNLFNFLNTIPPYWQPYREMYHEMVGNPKADSTMMASVSPALQVEKIKTPLFIAQGASDPRVNKAETDKMVEALKKQGVEVEYMVKENEGHGFRNEANRFDFYRAMAAFLEKHL